MAERASSVSPAFVHAPHQPRRRAISRASHQPATRLAGWYARTMKAAVLVLLLAGVASAEPARPWIGISLAKGTAGGPGQGALPGAPPPRARAATPPGG